MSDRFKFRAWNRIVKRMSDIFTMDSLPENIQWHNLDIIQSTGRKDINRKLIFEGSVYELKLDGIETHIEFVNCVAKWNDDMCAFGWNRISEDSDHPLWMNMNIKIYDMKFLGNAYQNKDLLKSSIEQKEGI